MHIIDYVENQRDYLEKANDFDEISSQSCVMYREVEFNDTYTYITVWRGIVDLDALMTESANTVLELSGAPATACNMFSKSCKIYEGSTVDNEFLNSLGLACATTISRYRMWKTAREKLLNGSVGAFYDFDEISGIIADIATLYSCTNYSELEQAVSSLILPWTFENNTIESFLRGYENQLMESKPAEDSPELYTYMNKVYALNNLRRNRKFNAYTLAFIDVKLKPMVYIEHRLQGLKERYLCEKSEEREVVR